MINPSDLAVQETFITTVVFNDEALEITYLKSEEQSDSTLEARTIVTTVGDDREMVHILGQVQELLRDLIDRIVVNRRAEVQASNGGTPPPPAVSIQRRVTDERAAQAAAEQAYLEELAAKRSDEPTLFDDEG